MQRRFGKTAILLVVAWPALAQKEIAIDWAEKRMTQYPTVVDRDEPVVVRVTKVNDFLYVYSGRLIARPLAADAGSFDDIPRAATASDDCSLLIGRVDEVLKDRFTLTETEPVESRPLAESLADWRGIAEDAAKIWSSRAINARSIRHSFPRRSSMP